MTTKDIFEIGKTYYCKWNIYSKDYFINTITNIKYGTTKNYFIGINKTAKNNYLNFRVSTDYNIDKSIIVELTKPFTKQNYPEYFI